MSPRPVHPRDPDAADYVLGVMEGAERRAFERAIAQDPALAAAVRDWEGRMSPLAEDVAPVVPSSGLLERLEAALDAATGSNVRRLTEADFGRLQRSRSVWRGIAAGAASLAAALALFIAIDRVAPSGSEPAASGLVAVVNRSGDLPALIVRVDPRNRVVQVRSVSTEVPAGRALELWSVAGGGPPRSLGVIEGRIARKAMPADAGAMAEGVTLAVSVEPPGGSPTGAPTGPVVYSGKLVPDAP